MKRKFNPALFGIMKFGHFKFGRYANTQPDPALFGTMRFGYFRFGVYKPVFDKVKKKLEKSK